MTKRDPRYVTKVGQVLQAGVGGPGIHEARDRGENGLSLHPASSEGPCGVDTDRIQTLASLLSSSVTREAFFYLPEPQFPNLSNRKNSAHLRKFHSFIED